MTAPAGELAERVLAELADLARAMERLDAHAAAQPPTGLTEPDQPSGERWDAQQVWAHLAEFGSYWLPELLLIVDTASDEPVPFGRTKTDPHRIAEIECHRYGPVAASRLPIAGSDETALTGTVRLTHETAQG